MSLMDKLKSMFSGGSSDAADTHDHDHAGHDHSHEPDAPPLPAADLADTGTEEGESTPN
jgi:hypothetical protein